MPADHVIEPEQELEGRFARPSNLLMISLILYSHSESNRPSQRQATAISHRGEHPGTRTGVPISRVIEFKEKPKEPEAERFVTSGDYFWNSGIFVWKPAAILGELQRRKPLIHEAILRIASAWGTSSGPDLFRTEYDKVEAKSINYAVMEAAANAGKVLVMHLINGMMWVPRRWNTATHKMPMEIPCRPCTRVWIRKTA